MINPTKVSYSSSLYYPEIIYNQVHTIAPSQEITIPFTGNSIPYIRVWGELFSGEFSQVFASSVQYAFMWAYEDAGIYGYYVSIEPNLLRVRSDNPSNRQIYVRMYVRE